MRNVSYANASYMNYKHFWIKFIPRCNGTVFSVSDLTRITYLIGQQEIESSFPFHKASAKWFYLEQKKYVQVHPKELAKFIMNRDMKFPTLWHFGMNRLRRACVASF